MVKNFKYKGGGLGKSEHGMYSFPIDLGYQKNKNGLGSDQNTKQTMGPIKFIKECNMIKLSNDIDEELCNDDIIRLEFDCFNTDDDILEYMGVHSELPKLNDKRKTNYILSEHVYFGQDMNFNEVFQV